MSSFAVTDQLSMCRYVSISAQKTSNSNPRFMLYVDEAKKADGYFSAGTTDHVQEYQLFVSGAAPAIGTVFQVHAEGAIIKNVNFPLEALGDYNRKALFHGVKIGYIGSPQYTFTIDGVSVSPMTPSSLTTSALPRSAVLYFPALTSGFVAHIQRTANSTSNGASTFGVGDNLTSIQFISQPIDE